MTFQLVLQFNSDSLSDYDAMVTLEDELIQELGDAADVDGHDIGSGQTNIFIVTSDPESTFGRAKAKGIRFTCRRNAVCTWSASWSWEKGIWRKCANC